jgi:hypothetical protein
VLLLAIPMNLFKLSLFASIFGAYYLFIASRLPQDYRNTTKLLNNHAVTFSTRL